MMRPRLLSIALLLAFGAACDASSSPSSFADTDDTGGVDDVDTDTTTVNAMGTQVGSEGIFGCEVLGTQTVASPDTKIEGLELPPDALFATLAGKWIGVTSTTGGDTPTTLTIGPAVTYTWVEVEAVGDCADYLAVETSAALEADPFASAILDGVLGIRPDQRRLVVSTSLSALSGDTGPTIFDPAEMDETVLILDAPLTDTELNGAFAFEGCVGEDCTRETLGTLAAVR